MCVKTSDQKELKEFIVGRIPGVMKVVLKKADKQKIPMELPEAREIAIDEIIEAEKKAEIKRVINTYTYIYTHNTYTYT